MGSDFAGVVEQVGIGVTRFEPGDEVVGSSPRASSGAFAEKLITRENLIAEKPPDLTFEEAAVLPIPITTAWLIGRKAKLQRGSQVFINGASGAVGLAFIGLFRPIGVEITGRVGPREVDHPEKIGLLQALDYTQPIPASLNHSFDLVFDPGGTLKPKEADLLRRPSGIIIDIVTSFSKVWRAVLLPHRSIRDPHPVLLREATRRNATRDRVALAHGFFEPASIEKFYRDVSILNEACFLQRSCGDRNTGSIISKAP
jgi:NADPH:quinone reductase-like Zn-dependent oxidoreductase